MGTNAKVFQVDVTCSKSLGILILHHEFKFLIHVAPAAKQQERQEANEKR